MINDDDDDDVDDVVDDDDDDENENSNSKKKANANFPPPDVKDSALKAAGNDDELANLLLAWYYAGFYTGQFSNSKSREKEENIS